MHTHMQHTTPFQQSCAHKPERNKKGARLPVAQLVFCKLGQETAQRLLQKTTDNYDKQPNQNQQKSFTTFSREHSADHNRSVAYISILLPLSNDWGGDVRLRVDSESELKYSKYFGCCPPTLRHKHLKSAKYGNFPENWVNQEPKAANDMNPTPW